MESSGGNEKAGDLAEELCRFLEEKTGFVLSTWLQHFDTNNDQRVTAHEFSRAMKNLGYVGDIKRLFAGLDDDGSRELSLNEVCPDQATLWQDFRLWCVRTFKSREEMCRFLSGRKGAGISRTEFVRRSVELGWQGGSEDLLFNALDLNQKECVEADDLEWLDVEIRRQRRKDEAKRLAAAGRRPMTQMRGRGTMLLLAFKRFLLHKYGGYVQAWRNGLSPDGLTHLQRAQFFKACADMGWQKDVRILWKAFDKDESGYIVIDELDLASAELLARFHKFVMDKFGGTAACFKAMDVKGRRKVKLEEFAYVLKKHGAHLPPKTLFAGMDRYRNGYLVEDDMEFLERWRPLPFLLARPNRAAMEEFKRLLLKTYKNYLRAWRRVLDVDNTNRCNWDEFQNACKRVGFAGDIAGAWRALDEDLYGEITLATIDGYSSERLMSFKLWATEEFGGVFYAFGVFDDDGSNSISSLEFRSACRIYGFPDDAVSLFRALDVEGSGTLSRKEVAFLDNWEFEEKVEREISQRKCALRGASEAIHALHLMGADATATKLVGTPPSDQQGHAVNLQEDVARITKFLGGAGAERSHSPLALSGVNEPSLRRGLTKPVTPRVLERSAERIRLQQQESVERIVTVNALNALHAQTVAPWKSCDEVLERVQPSLDLAEDVYGKSPSLRSRPPPAEILPGLGLSAATLREVAMAAQGAHQAVQAAQAKVADFRAQGGGSSASFCYASAVSLGAASERTSASRGRSRGGDPAANGPTPMPTLDEILFQASKAFPVDLGSRCRSSRPTTAAAATSGGHAAATSLLRPPARPWTHSVRLPGVGSDGVPGRRPLATAR
eukprot:TRINITY_DN14186_c0_g1_i2.p1 TRINITY_DN14186_c0_g1~~TRINITY_DN14186_c0_g1_i2.p1  ORF type:complete len:838 (-),score=171.73 TRINITY_DN14186_c0_g1_i2:191-2704(-)